MTHTHLDGFQWPHCPPLCPSEQCYCKFCVLTMTGSISVSLTPGVPPLNLFCWLNFTFPPLLFGFFFFVFHYGASMVLSSLTKLIISSLHLSLCFSPYLFSTSGLYNFIKCSTCLLKEDFQLHCVVFTPCSFTNKPSCLSQSLVYSVFFFFRGPQAKPLSCTQCSYFSELCVSFPHCSQMNSSRLVHINAQTHAHTHMLSPHVVHA